MVEHIASCQNVSLKLGTRFELGLLIITITWTFIKISLRVAKTEKSGDHGVIVTFLDLNPVYKPYGQTSKMVFA